jgi:hypothetical protein
MNFRDAPQRFEHGGRVFAFDCHHGDGANALRFGFCGFSTDPTTRDGFGSFTPGFRVVPFGDAAALDAATHLARRVSPERRRHCCKLVC